MVKFSFIIPAYNHSAYVERCLNSILAQTIQDFDVWMIDDCSADDTFQKMQAFAQTDNRIHVARNDFNKGINANLNTMMYQAAGDWFCFIASDDMVIDTYLEYLSDLIAEHPAARVFYGAMMPVDDNDCLIQREMHKFVRPTRPRTEILNDLFLRGNKLASPGMCFHRDLLKYVDLNPALIQEQDYEMHIRLLLHADCFVSPKRVVYYRRPANKSNISAFSNAVEDRVNIEEDFVMNIFKTSKDMNLLNDVFKSELKALNLKITSENLDFVLAVLALNSPIKRKKEWGYATLLRLIESMGMDRFYQTYGVDFKGLLNYSKKISIGGKDKQKRLKRYQKLMELFMGLSGVLLLTIVWLIYR